MSEKEKYDSFEKSIISYDKEVGENGEKEKYSYDLIEKSDGEYKNMTQEEYETMKIIEGEIVERLEAAVKAGIKADSLEALEIAEEHKKWLMYKWGEYTHKAHLALVEKYKEDKKYKDYYDVNVSGCAEFLQSAVKNYIARDQQRTASLDANIDN